MPFGIDESRNYGLIDIWCTPAKAKRWKKVVNFCLDTVTVGGFAALGAVAYESATAEVCAYGARRIARGVCVVVLTPAAAASVGSVMIAYSAATKTSRVYKSGQFMWHSGMGIIKMVKTGATVPQQGISYLLCGQPYTPLIHNETIVNSTNMTAVTEGFKDGLSIVNATVFKEAAKEAAIQAAKEAFK